jgi:signal transduction histidine kinase
MQNALKYTTQGSIIVRASGDRQKQLLIISVSDTGIGIDPKEIGSLFILFGKLKNSSTINANGVGMGLSLCKMICRALGGDIEV